MSNSAVNISLKGKNDPTVNITVNEAGTISGTGSVSPVINFVATGEQGAVGAQGETGSLSASDSVTQANMADNSVGTNEIINGSVTNTKLANNSVYVHHIVDGSVSTSKMENEAVTEGKLADNAVTADKLADNAITAADITRIVENNAFTTALIAYGAVTAEEIANYNITNPKIADNAVDSRSLDSDLTLEGETNLQAIRLGSSDGVLRSHEDYDLIFKYDQNIFFKDFNDNTIFSIDQSGNITTLGTIDGVDVGTSVTANNAKVGITTAQANAIVANTAKETNETTDLSVTASSTFLRMESSDGGDVLLPPATPTSWGVMSDEDKAKLDGIEAGATADQTTEEIEDIVGNVVATGGTKTGIAITYDDDNGNMDFVVDHDAATNFVAEEHYRWDNDIQSTATINHANLSSDTGSDGEALVIIDGDAVWGHPEKIHLQVRNDEGATIPAGAPLYSKIEIGGSGRLKVGICDANDPAKMPCIGLAEAEMNTTSTKDNFAITQGIYNTNISGFTSLDVGDNLYIQNDGSLSQSKPTGETSLIQNVGIVLRTNGSICQGMLVSAIGRTNDVPNLDSGNIFLGNASNVAQTTTVAAAIEGAGNITIDGDLKLDDDIIKGSSGNVILSSVSDIVKTPLGLFTNAVSGHDNADFELKAGGNIQFTLDVDDNETAQSFSFRDGGTFGSFTEIANLNQSGDLVIEGDLTVKGNQISGTNLASVLTFGTGTTTLTGSLETSSTIYTNQLWSYGTDGDINIRSQNDINLIIDGNNNADRELKIQRAGSGGEDDIVVIDESGVMTMYGTQLGQPAITLQQNSQTATYGPPVFNFFRNSVNSDDSDIGRIDFEARDSAGSETTYARILGLTEESGSGTEGGQIRLQVASHDGEMVTGLKIEDGDAEDEVDITIGNGSDSTIYIPGALNAMGSSYFGSTPIFAQGLDVGSSDTTITRTAAGEVSIEGKKIVTENQSRQIINCGWVGNSTALAWLPFGYGGTGEAFMYSSNAGYLESGGFVAPCDGYVDFVVVRAETAAGFTEVGVHVAPEGTEVPSSSGDYAFTSSLVNMSSDDTGYKFSGFTNDNNVTNSFSAGDVIMISFDPSTASGDSVATAVLVLDWTNSL